LEKLRMSMSSNTSEYQSKACPSGYLRLRGVITA
jgi:hypothetical protein